MINHQKEVKNVPYYSQWESASLIKNILSGETDAKDDPLWYRSGAGTRQDYKVWSGHICGMACLRMTLKYALNIDTTLFLLLLLCTKYGGYKVQGDEIKGLYYFPFVKFINTVYGFSSYVVENISIQQILPHLKSGSIFIASVHPAIRDPEAKPPYRGGHLVLVHSFYQEKNCIVFHNPSGTEESNQANVFMSIERFDEFFANRGIVIPLSSSI